MLGTVALIACSNGVTDTLLEATDPDIIDPSNVQSAEGASAVRVGALGRLRSATSSSESTWLFGGLLADEWSTSSTFVQNDETDERRIDERNSSITGFFRNLERVRTASNQAIRLLNKWKPSPASDIAEMYLARGFAEMQLAQDFCNGIPLSDASGDSLIYDKGRPVEEVFTVAIASFDSALALATATDTATVTIDRAARIGKARALMGVNKYAEAAALVPASTVPTTFNYLITFSTTSGVGDNILWNQPASQRRYTIGDSLEGNSGNLLVRNAIPFFRAKDPRLPVSLTVSSNGRDTTKGQDGFTFSRTTTLYGRTTPVALLNGIDARFIEAEALLKADNAAGMMAILNALRANPPKVGEVQATAAQLPPLADPGTRDARINLLFREKAFWTFSRGQRLGDLRRLIRQYGRPGNQVFPEGEHYRGGTYGPDVNLPVPYDERVNVNFTGCLDRKA
jgi:starch-binding outer membrane protein, SusD/RagB family